MILRKFELGDEEAILNVLFTSIRYSYERDYSWCSEQSLQDWLENKTSENIRKWMSSPENCHTLAVIEEKVIGLGLMSLESGRFDLCYVHPDFMGYGAGKAILADIEKMALEHGCSKIHFTSSIGAQAFYEKWGAQLIGEEEGMSGESMNPVMEKCLK